jgi:hypothetical protein
MMLAENCFVTNCECGEPTFSLFSPQSNLILNNKTRQEFCKNCPVYVQLKNIGTVMFVNLLIKVNSLWEIWDGLDCGESLKEGR